MMRTISSVLSRATEGNNFKNVQFRELRMKIMVIRSDGITGHSARTLSTGQRMSAEDMFGENVGGRLGESRRHQN